MATNAQSSEYVTVATFVVKDEGLESLPEGRESSESIENVVTNDHDPGTVQVSYFDAEEAAEVITSGEYDEANHEAEIQEEDGSHKPWRKGGNTTLWSLPAVRALLDIYEEHEQEYVNKTVRRRVFWEIVAEKMKERGFEYDWCSCRVRFKGMCRKVLSLAMHGRSKLTRRLWWEERVERIMENLDQEFVRMRQARRRTVSDASAASTSFGGAVAFQAGGRVTHREQELEESTRLVIEECSRMSVSDQFDTQKSVESQKSVDSLDAGPGSVFGPLAEPTANPNGARLFYD
ncbi:hypothetical protein C7M84_025202 [Penaeus vannamei]|uniref:Myb/SANT-like DNA-binding domain-containing protein n=1 Tax=Penaeus vannamei TaxID=6689 RepID=A0A3R7NA93_PENVA|nr:hypothetical protein C7M84_025202 [Penaeus vannamei]